jgi:hypothetical protein
VPAIPKGQKNKQQNYAFRGIDDVFNALHGLFAKHGVVILPEVLKAEYVQQLAGSNQNLATDARLLIRYHFVAGDGSSVSMTVQGESRDYADKATNQAMSGGYKAGLLQMFLIPLEGMPEQDSESPTIEDPLTEEEVDRRAIIAVKTELVLILGTAEAASTFWDTHQGMNPRDMVQAAHQKVLDDTEIGEDREATPEEAARDRALGEMDAVDAPDSEPDPEIIAAVELLKSLTLGKVPARKTLLQQGISDMARLGGADEWLELQLAAGGAAGSGRELTDLEVKELKVLFAGLQKELTSNA